MLGLRGDACGEVKVREDEGKGLRLWASESVKGESV